MKKTVKIFLRILAIALGIFFLVSVLIMLPPVQRVLIRKTVAYFNQTTGANATIKSIRIGFPRSVIIRGIKVEDQQADTMLYCNKLDVTTDLLTLFRKKIDLKTIRIDEAQVHLFRPANDSAFNYQFIVDAFSNNDSSTTESSSSPWEFEIKNIALNDIDFTMTDQLDSMQINTRIGLFKLDFSQFNLNENKLGIDKILLEKSAGMVILNRKKPAIQASPTAEGNGDSSRLLPIDLGLRSLEINQTSFKFMDAGSGLTVHTNLSTFIATFTRFNLNDYDLAIDQLDGSDLYAEIINPPGKITNATPPTSTGEKIYRNQLIPDFPWKFSIASSTVDHLRFTYQNGLDQQSTSQFDPENIHVDDLNWKFDSLQIDDQNLSAGVQHLALKMGEQFHVVDFGGTLDMGINHILAREIRMETDRSNLFTNINISCDNVWELLDKPALLNGTIDMETTDLFPEDFYFFMPHSTSTFSQNIGHQPVQIKFQAAANNGVLHVEKIELNRKSSITLISHGTLSLVNPKNLFGDIELDTLVVEKSFAQQFIPQKYANQDIHIPSWIRAKGRLVNSSDSLNASLKLYGNAGKMMINGRYEKNAGDSLYVQAIIPQLDLGVIFPDKSLGEFSGHFNFNGTYKAGNFPEGRLESVIKTLNYRQYNYRDISARGLLKNKILQLDLKSPNDALNFDLSGRFDVMDSVKTADVDIVLNQAKLLDLNLSPNIFNIKSSLKLTSRFTSANDLSGHILLDKLMLEKPGKNYNLNAADISVGVHPDSLQFKFNSEFANAYYNGNVHFSDLTNLLKNEMNHYLYFNDSIKQDNPYYFDFDINIHKTDLFTDFLVRDLDALQVARFNGHYDSRDNQLKVNINIPNVVYKHIDFDSLKFDILSGKSQMQWQIQCKQIGYDTLAIRNINQTGSLQDNTLVTTFQSRSRLGKIIYGIADQNELRG